MPAAPVVPDLDALSPRVGTGGDIVRYVRLTLVLECRPLPMGRSHIHVQMSVGSVATAKRGPAQFASQLHALGLQATSALPVLVLIYPKMPHMSTRSFARHHRILKPSLSSVRIKRALHRMSSRCSASRIPSPPGAKDLALRLAGITFGSTPRAGSSGLEGGGALTRDDG